MRALPHGADAVDHCLLTARLHPLQAAAGAPNLVDAVLPGAFCRTFWTKALLHPSVLVRLGAANALNLLLPLLKTALTDRLATLAARAATGAQESSAALGTRLLTAELMRRLPDTQVVVRLKSVAAAGGGGGGGGGGGRGGGSSGSGGGGDAGGSKLSNLLESRMLRALRLYALILPSTASDAAAHAERLLKGGAEALTPLSRYHALMLLRERTHAASAAHGQPSAAALGATWAAAADTMTLPPAADLAALLRLAISPQPAPLREPLWGHICDQLSRSAPLHLAAPLEPSAWLRAVTCATDAKVLFPWRGGMKSIRRGLFFSATSRLNCSKR